MMMMVIIMILEVDGEGRWKLMIYNCHLFATIQWAHFATKSLNGIFWIWQRPLTSVHCSVGGWWGWWHWKKSHNTIIYTRSIAKGCLLQPLLAMTNVPDNHQLSTKINSSNMRQIWVNVWLLCSESASMMSQRSLIANQSSSPFVHGIS